MNPYSRQLQDRLLGKTSTRRARVEIVPLIDVMFLLVAFFMVASISMVVQRGIMVDLSSAETGESSSKEKEGIVLSVDRSGALYLNKELLDDEALLLELRDRSFKDTSQLVTVNADREAQHQYVIQALDLVRKAGLTNLVFAVEPSDRE